MTGSKQNDISISVYEWEPVKKNKDGYAYTLRVAEDVKPNHVNLVMIGDEVKHFY